MALFAALVPACAAGTFEQAHRIVSLTMQFGTDSFAASNRLGTAFAGSLTRSELQTALDDAVADGSLSVLFTFPGLNDLTGTNEPALEVHLLNGAPVILSDNPATYSGTSDLDWWYARDPNSVDAEGNASQRVNGSIAARVLNAGPGRFSFAPGALGTFSMSSFYLRASIGGSTAPLRSTNDFPPGHRPSENLDPALMSFATMTSGQMKGNVSAISLASTPIPAALTSGFACSQGYMSDNTLLDVIVGGCSGILGTQVQPSQPDQVDPSAPVLGAGPPYTFTRTGTRVTGCRDRLNNFVDLQAGLNAAAYSAYFTFTTDRVIALRPPALPLRLIDVEWPGNGALRFAFTNRPGAFFTVFSATNIESAATNWILRGSPQQPSPGRFEFTDPQATGTVRQFFKVRSP